jgi:hypothetical protein
MTRIVVRLDWIGAGVGAGLTAAATLAAFAAFAQWFAGDPISGTYTYLAHVLAGPAADGAAWAVPTGVATLIAASLLWSFGYLYAAEQQPQLFTRPFVSGLVFGVVVWVIMQLVLLPFGMFHPTGMVEFDREIFGLMFCFGLPLAFTAARLTRTR